MKLPKFIRYFKCRARLMHAKISFDISEKEQILNSYFSSKFIEFNNILSNTMLDEYIRFTIKYTDYKNNTQFQLFEKNAKSLCNRFGYTLDCGSSGSNDEQRYYYGVFPSRIIQDVKYYLETNHYDFLYRDMYEKYYAYLDLSKYIK
jgi:hypothetical protein